MTPHDPPSPGSATPPPAIDYAAARADLAAAEVSLKPIRRVVRVAMVDAWTIAIFAAPTFLCGLFGGVSGVLLGAATVIVAYFEFKNAARLRRLELAALDRLVVNQLVLAGVLIVYSLWSLYALHGGGLLASMKGELPGVDLGALGPDADSMDRSLSVDLYGGLIIITVLAQGGMALYYARRRRPLAELVSRLPAWVIEMQRGDGSDVGALQRSR